MVRFKIGLSRFINRLSLMSSLKLLVSEVKTSKSSEKSFYHPKNVQPINYCIEWSRILFHIAHVNKITYGMRFWFRV